MMSYLTVITGGTRGEKSMNEDKNREDSRVEMGDQIANMSRLDFLLLLWEARIVGEDYVEANT